VPRRRRGRQAQTRDGADRDEEHGCGNLKVLLAQARQLPSRGSDFETEPTMDTVPVNQSTPVMLYVENHPINAMLMANLFEFRPSLRLVLATSVADALLQATQLQPTLLLLDIHLPAGNGCDLLPRLRCIPGCAFAPAVAVTAARNFDIQGSGFTELWTKPLNLQKVLERLNALTGPALAPSPLATRAVHDRPHSRQASAW